MGVQTEGLLSSYLRNKRIAVAQPFLEGRILDFGCGVGKLSKLISPGNYIGVDIDEISIEIAKTKYPGYRFYTCKEFEQNKQVFDTIVCLAVIEHIKQPVDFLKYLSTYLDNRGKIILTTPHPSMEFIHYFGSRIGLFSLEANRDHERLLDKKSLFLIAHSLGFKIVKYKRFLYGANQLVVLKYLNP